MRRLEQLYQDINDVTMQVTNIKEQNKAYDTKNQLNQRKIKHLKVIHQCFLD
jgi:hypothetical protein